MGGTPEEAVTIVRERLGNSMNGYALSCFGLVNRDGKDYFAIQLYENFLVDTETGEERTETIGWYFVEKMSGMVYVLNLAESKLEPFRILIDTSK